MKSTDAVRDGLNRSLGDAVVFWYKLHHHHWLVRGEAFFELHAKFEDLYTRWSVVLDDLAERVIAVGGTPVSTLAGVLEHARIEEGRGRSEPAALVESTVADLKAQHGTLGALLATAEGAGDRGTVNLLDGIRDGIEKDIWMLEAYLGA